MKILIAFLNIHVKLGLVLWVAPRKTRRGCDSTAPDEEMSLIHSSGSSHSDHVSGNERKAGGRERVKVPVAAHYHQFIHWCVDGGCRVAGCHFDAVSAGQF